MELQKTENHLPSQQTVTSLPMIRITKPTDLLQARPMREMAKDYGQDPVLNEIKKSLVKCAAGLNIQLGPGQVDVLSDDIFEVYNIADSVEDVIQCLKKGRQGKYSFGHNNRQSLTMTLIQEWMGKHLDEKAEAREKALSEAKAKVIEYTNDKDFYEEYKKRMRVEDEKKKAQREAESERMKEVAARFRSGKTAEQLIKEHEEKVLKGREEHRKNQQ